MKRRRVRRRRLVALLVLVGIALLVGGGIALARSAASSASGSDGAGGGMQSSSTTSTSTDTSSSGTSSTDASSTDGVSGVQDAGSQTAAASGGNAATPTPSTTAPKRPTTTEPPETTTTAAPAPKEQASSGAEGMTVVVDPGHQGPQDLSYEPIGPGSSTTKYKMSSGATGVSTGLAESLVDLQISLKLRDELEARGINVVMTRTSQDVNISNIERAQIANEAGAALFIRVHCDAIDSSSPHGIHVLYPVNIPGWTDDIYSASRRAAQLTQEALIEATGAYDRGLDERDDMTGFNWSDVPVIMPELGFMSNPEEDRLLASSDYQQKLAQAMAEAAVRFLRGD